MKKMFIGDLYQIQCYKHDGKIHRAWDEAVLLDIKKDYLFYTYPAASRTLPRTLAFISENSFDTCGF